LNNVNNWSDADKEVTVEAQILSPEGEVLASSEEKRKMAAGSTRQFDHRLTVTNPERWDVDNPVRYSVKTIVKDGDKVLDTQVIPFGFRTFKFTANDGFFLNDRHLQIQGVN